MKLLSAILLAEILIFYSDASANEIEWQPWSDSVFAKLSKKDDCAARSGNWLVSLVHVMEEVTYRILR